MAVGKNIFFIVDGIPLHNALKSFSSEMTTDELDATVLGSNGAFRQYVGGFKAGMISLEGIWNSDTTNDDEIHDVMSAAFDGQTTKQLLASFGTIVVGSPALIAQDAKVISYSVTPNVGELIMANAELRADNAVEPGVWMFNGSATSTSVNGTTVDNAAPSANGGHYQGHTYLASDSTATNSSYKLQHSPDGSTWADKEVAQAVGATKGSISREVAGTIDRYTRIVFTATGGKAYGAAALVRR